jgi:hypothetical protein
MSKGPQTFKRTDVDRLLRAAQKAALPKFNIRVTKDAMVLEVVTDAGKVPEAGNEWNEA